MSAAVFHSSPVAVLGAGESGVAAALLLAAEGVPVAVIENPGAVSPGLVADIETQAQEVAYLAGVAAGLTTSDEVIKVAPPSHDGTAAR